MRQKMKMEKNSGTIIKKTGLKLSAVLENFYQKSQFQLNDSNQEETENTFNRHEHNLAGNLRIQAITDLKHLLGNSVLYFNIFTRNTSFSETTISKEKDGENTPH